MLEDCKLSDPSLKAPRFQALIVKMITVLSTFNLVFFLRAYRHYDTAVRINVPSRELVSLNGGSDVVQPGQVIRVPR